MSGSGIHLTTLGHRIRHHRVAKGLTLDDLGAKVGVAGSQLSLIENGKREPKLSLLQAIAHATGTEVADLISDEPPNRRAALEIELEKAQASPVFRQLGIDPVRVSKGMPDETIESILGLHRELQRREREAIATPARPFCSDASATIRQPGSASSRCSTSPRTSCSVMMSGAACSTHSPMPLRAAARIPLTLTEATRMVREVMDSSLGRGSDIA